VGRKAELDQLQDAWTTRRRLTEIVGESGIGKTRLVAELVTNLAETATVLWVRCSQDRLGSYVPFVEILRHLVAQVDAGSLRAAVGARGELTRLVPELVDRVGETASPEESGSGQ
jgi:predicted ATPase